MFNRITEVLSRIRVLSTFKEECSTILTSNKIILDEAHF